MRYDLFDTYRDCEDEMSGKKALQSLLHGEFVLVGPNCRCITQADMVLDLSDPATVDVAAMRQVHGDSHPENYMDYCSDILRYRCIPQLDLSDPATVDVAAMRQLACALSFGSAMTVENDFAIVAGTVGYAGELECAFPATHGAGAQAHRTAYIKQKLEEIERKRTNTVCVDHGDDL